MIPYPTEDYKKYIYALGMHRVRRLYDVFGGLDLDLEKGSALSLYTTIDIPTEEEHDCDPPDPPDLLSQVSGHKSGGTDKMLSPASNPPTPLSVRPAMDGKQKPDKGRKQVYT